MSHVWGINQFSVKWKFLPVIVPFLDIISFAASHVTRRTTLSLTSPSSKTPQWSQLSLRSPFILSFLQPWARSKPLKPPVDGLDPLPWCRPRLPLLKPHRPQVLLLSPRPPPVTRSTQLGRETPTRGLFYLQGHHGPRWTLVAVSLKSTV